MCIRDSVKASEMDHGQEDYHRFGNHDEQRIRSEDVYKRQDCNLLLGFFCDLDGDDTITMDEKELSTAEWFERDEMPVDDDGFSLTREMMSIFKRGVM